MTDQRHTVVLIHGFAASSLVMAPLAWRLSRRGFNTTYWSYPSLFKPIATHAGHLAPFLEQLDRAGSHFHMVAHSMGSIITRAALQQASLNQLGRVVFLAPPNSGLPAARLAPNFVKRFIPPMVDLSDATDSFVNSMSDELNCDVGIIASRFDIMIPVANTHLRSQRDHAIVHCTHNSLLVSSSVAGMVERFLTNGQFASL